MTINERNTMKQYKLLKDLPFAKAGEIFKRHTFKSKDGLSDYDYFEICKLKHGEINETAFGIKRNEFIDNLDEWLEEIKEPEFFYYIDEKGLIAKMRTDYRHADIHLRKAIGNYFETEEEAEEHLEWLKARAVLLEDTKGSSQIGLMNASGSILWRMTM